MISIIDRTVKGGGDYIYKYVGLSTDEKPKTSNGSTFEEMDTGNVYRFNKESEGWIGKADKYLASLTVTSAPAKTSYIEGQRFVEDGLAVQAGYTDGSTAAVKEFETLYNDPLTVNDTVIKVKYIENGIMRIAEQPIVVKPCEATDEESFIEVLAAADHVKLEGDITLSNPVAIDHDFTLDLNGHELATNTNEPYLFNVSGADLTIKGGRIDAKLRIGSATNGGSIIIVDGEYKSLDIPFTAQGEGSSVVLNDGSLSGVEGGIGAFDKANIEMNGGSVTVSDNFTLFTNGTAGRGGNTIVMNGGYLEGNIVSSGYESVGVYIANNDTFTMNGGKIVSNNGCGICMRGGNVTINDGEIVCGGEPGTTGMIGDSPIQMTKTAVIYHESANYPGKAGMSLTINGGKFTGVDHSVEVLSNEEKPNVTISGGTFNPPYPEPVEEPVDEPSEATEAQETVEPDGAVSLKSIAFTTAPKVEYNVGDNLDLTGAVVTAKYDDDTAKEVTGLCTFVPADGAILSAEDTKVTASYTENGVTKTVWKKLTVNE